LAVMRNSLWQSVPITHVKPCPASARVHNKRPENVIVDRDELPPSHTAVKPVLMIAEAIRHTTRRGEAVLDTALGSDATVIAAEEIRRVGIGLDVDPLYVDVAVRRWQSRTRRRSRPNRRTLRRSNDAQGFSIAGDRT
jgi:DNA modification methylase